MFCFTFDTLLYFLFSFTNLAISFLNSSATCFCFVLKLVCCDASLFFLFLLKRLVRIASKLRLPLLNFASAWLFLLCFSPRPRVLRSAWLGRLSANGEPFPQSANKRPWYMGAFAWLNIRAVNPSASVIGFKFWCLELLVAFSLHLGNQPALRGKPEIPFKGQSVQNVTGWPAVTDIRTKTL